MTEISLFLLALSALCVVAFIYPYFIYPLVLRCLRDVPSTPVDPDAPLPSAALLMCAYNEEAALPAKIENLRRMKFELPQLKIYAYSDCSSDATAELLRGASDLLTPVIGEERAGKVRGMQKLVQMCDADVAIFTDANVMVDEGSVTALLNYFRDPQIGAVAATLIYEDQDDVAGSATAEVGSTYWRLEEHIKKLESRSGSMMGADGAFFARRRPGYPKIPADLVDDMAVSVGVLFDGQRCVSAPDVVGREHSVSNRAEEFRRKRRIACGSYSTYRYLAPGLRKLPLLDRFKFLSHKVMRWWGAMYLLAGLMFALAAAFVSGVGALTAAVLVVAGGVFVLLGHLQVRCFRSLYEMLLAVIATGLGVMESWRGRTYATWEPAKTR